LSNQGLHTLKRTSYARLARGARTGPSAAGGTLVFSSKLHPPTARPGIVVRQALLDRLDEALSAKLVLLVAPAGWGKTALLCDWFSARETERTAWLSVDQGDNEPVRFWAHVIAAVNTVCPGIGASALEMLTAPGTKTADAVLSPLINDFAGIPARVTLVLDDYHLISNRTITERMEFLAEHLPPALGLVLASRSDPALPLARLRARGQMAEIRADELRFSEDETTQLLNGTVGVQLPADAVHALHHRTEGWAAGLYLAGLSLRGRADADREVHAFHGDDRKIVDYLAAEVLDGLPAQTRSLLVQTSVLERLCGPLCDAVTRGSGSQRQLEEIERSQLFLVPLDSARRWYRYHTLFAELLRHELEVSEPGLAPLLHRRASLWHREHGSIPDAIGHAIAAGDLADARELIVSNWNPLVHRGLAGTAESWLDRLPPEMVLEDARMCIIRAFLALHLGRPDEIDPWLDAAQAGVPQGPFRPGPSSVESAALMARAGRLLMAGDLAGSEPASRQAVELEATGTAQWQAVAMATLGAGLAWRGRDAEARAVLAQVVAPTRAAASTVATLQALGCLALMAIRGGDVEAGERSLDKAATLAGTHDLSQNWATATITLASAELLERRGELRGAEDAALRGLQIARHGMRRPETGYALLCLARIKARAGNREDAQAYVREAREVISNCAEPGILAELMTATDQVAGQHLPIPRPRAGTPARRADGLTAREAQVLELLAAGDTNNEIAVKLVVSVHTVERHLQNAYRKVGVRNRADAAVYITRTTPLGPSCRSAPQPACVPHDG
jgi:LuxR family transcriptional regulator, maltose regulon positive regulatory protein